MKSSLIDKFAKQSGKPVREVEAYWNDAIKAADAKFGSPSVEYWTYVSSTVKQKLGIKGKGFKEFFMGDNIGGVSPVGYMRPSR